MCNIKASGTPGYHCYTRINDWRVFYV